MAKFKVIQGVSRGGYQLQPGIEYETSEFSQTFIDMLNQEKVISYKQTDLSLNEKVSYTGKINDSNGYNIEEGLRSFRYALADIDRNPLKVACIGDSVTFGSYASDVFATSWVSRLRSILQSKYGNPGFGVYGVPYTGMPAASNKWTLAGTWTYGSGNGVFGKWINATGTDKTATITFTGTSCDLIIVQVPTGSASGATVTIDGNPVATPNFRSAGGTIWGVKQSYTGLSAGSHTMVITGATTDPIYIEGLIAYNPIAGTPKGCYVHNIGTPSRKASEYALQVSKLTPLVNAHLAIIAFSINDAKAAATDYFQSMSTLISTFQAAGASVLLIPYYAINDTEASVSNYLNMRDQMYQLCDKYNCALVDIYERWEKDFTKAQAAGLMGTGDWSGNAGSDQWHPSDKGHRDIANAISMNLIGSI